MTPPVHVDLAEEDEQADAVEVEHPQHQGDHQGGIQSDGHSQPSVSSPLPGFPVQAPAEEQAVPCVDMSAANLQSHTVAQEHLLMGVPTPLQSALRNPARDRSASSRRVSIKEATIEATKANSKDKLQEDDKDKLQSRRGQRTIQEHRTAVPSAATDAV